MTDQLLDLTGDDIDLSQMSADERLQLTATIKMQLDVLYASIGRLAATFTRQARGAVASHLVISTQAVNAYAEYWIEFGMDGFEPEAPLDDRWREAVLKSDEPQHWHEQGVSRKLTAERIREESGTKQERKPPAASGNGLALFEDTKITIFPDSVEDGNGHKECRVSYRLVEK